MTIGYDDAAVKTRVELNQPETGLYSRIVRVLLRLAVVENATRPPNQKYLLFKVTLLPSHLSEGRGGPTVQESFSKS